MPKILLTGGAGYIGSHITVCALVANYDVVLLDNYTNSNSEVLKSLESITGKKIDLIEGDVRDSKLLFKVLKDYGIASVIHLAGLKSVEESIAKPDLYYDNNIEGTKSLLDAMSMAGVFQLVFSSSATVYGEPEYLPLDEGHPVSFVNPYAESKILVEKHLQHTCEQNPNWQIASLRYFNPVGSHSSGLLGDNAKALRANLMPMIARVLTGKRDCLEIYGDDYDTPDGTCLRDYIHVMDLAEGHISTLKYLDGLKGHTAINLGTGKGVSVLQLVHAFERIIGSEIPLQFAPRRGGDVPACYAKCDKAKRLLGWEATRSLEEMCESTWLWCKRIET